MGTVSINPPKTPVTKGSNGIAAATVPNVCKMPGPPAPFVPTPLPNIGNSGDTPNGYSVKVKIEGHTVAIRGATFNSQGDIASKATGGGLVSANAHGPTKFVGPGSLNVTIEGKNVQLLSDPMLNNCGPSGSPPNSATMMGVMQAPQGDGGPEDPKIQPGAIEVTVVDSCKRKPIADAAVTVEMTKVRSNSSGIAIISGLTPMPYQVVVEKTFLDGKYSTFTVHYPRVLWSGKTVSSTIVMAEVESGGTVKSEVQLVEYRLIADIVFHRKHIALGASDKYGHWWTVIGGESYGWWPKYSLGDRRNRSSMPPRPPTAPGPDAGTLAGIGYMFSSAVYSAKATLYNLRESGPMQTFLGVEGELNGTTSFGGTSTMDPHHPDAGDEQYQPIINDCRSDDEIKQPMRDFAKGYSGNWSWFMEFGNHCHTFQKGMMSAAALSMYKVAK